MTEEVVEEVVEEEANPAAQRAMDDGWRPKEEWSGDPEDWIDYKEFNYRGELMGRIKEQSGVINSYKNRQENLEATVADLVEMNAKTAEAQYNKLLKGLEEQKAEAIEEADGKAVVQIDADIKALEDAHRDATVQRTAQQEPQTANQQQVEDPDVARWLQSPKNQWFNTDGGMRAAAQGIASTLVQENPDMSPVAVLAEMDKQMRDMMPHKFRGGSPTGGSDSNQRPNGGGSKKGRKLADLNEEEQAAAKRFAKTANLPIDKYIEMLDALED